MEDAIAEKLEQLGLDRRGVLSPTQAALAASRERDAHEDAGPHAAVRPGARELVLQTRIAGLDEPAVDAAAVAALSPGARLSVAFAARAADKPRDLRLLDSHGLPVGRFSRDDASELAALATAGEELSARVTSIDEHRDWSDVAIDVFAREAEPRRGAARTGERRA